MMSFRKIRFRAAIRTPPRLNWRINEAIYRSKGRTGEPPWRLEPRPGTEEAQTRLVRGGGKRVLSRRRNAGLEGLGRPEAGAGVGWGRTLSCSFPASPAELPVAAATGTGAGRDRNWEAGGEAQPGALSPGEASERPGKPRGGPWLPEQEASKTPSPRALCVSYLVPY